jgi:hypothetical protein
VPLHALTASGAVVRAWEITPEDWVALKRDYRDLGLTAPCCGAAVVPVRSSRGCRFFRHQADAACSVGETPEHIVCKTIIARAAAELGFEVRTEARAPDGGWTADVLVRRPDWTGDTAVAIEVQLSRIPLSEIEDRQERYEAAGIRGAWLVGYHLPGARPQRDLPLFRLVPRQGDVIAPVVLCHGEGGAGLRVGLAPFTEALLRRQVRFYGSPDEADVPAVVSIPSTCWRCCRDIELAVGLVNVQHTVFAPKGFLPAADLHKLPEMMAAYRRGVGALCAASDALTVLRTPPPAKEADGCRAHCPWCDAPISLRRLPSNVTDPVRWARCWTLAGKEWIPDDRKPARWVLFG